MLRVSPFATLVRSAGFIVRSRTFIFWFTIIISGIKDVNWFSGYCIHGESSLIFFLRSRICLQVRFESYLVSLNSYYEEKKKKKSRKDLDPFLDPISALDSGLKKRPYLLNASYDHVCRGAHGPGLDV